MSDSDAPSRHEMLAVDRIAGMLGATIAGAVILGVVAWFEGTPTWLLLSGMGLILFLFLGLSAREVVIYMDREDADREDGEF